MSACRSCGTSITWARTAAGRLMPLVEHVEGEFVTARDATQTLVLLRLDLLEPGDRRLGGKRYRSHLSDCPAGAVFRRTR